MGLLDFIKNLASGGTPAEGLAQNEPGSPALFEKCLDALIASDTQVFITIESENDEIIQVAKGGGVLRLNIASYPLAEHPNEKLNALGVALQEGSTLESWEANDYAQYVVPSPSTHDVATTIDALYRKLHGREDGYTVSISLEN
jgi:hypothetical protein